MAEKHGSAPKDLKKVFVSPSCGLKVSDLCLGTMNFSIVAGSNPWGFPTCGKDECFKILNRFVEAGGSFIDTYARASASKAKAAWSQKFLALTFFDTPLNDLNTSVRIRTVLGSLSSWSVVEYTKQKSDRTSYERYDCPLPGPAARTGAFTYCILTSATYLVRLPTGPGHNESGLSRRHILSAIEGSLENLQTDFIDIYYAHVWDAGTPLDETMRTFHDLVRAGKVRYIGVSNFSGWQLQKALSLSKYMGLERFVVFQGQYSLLCREAEFEILPCCADEGVGFLPWSPLKGGWLSGRYKRGMKLPEDGSRVDWSESAGWAETDFRTHNTEKTWRVLDEVEKIAKETNQSMASVSLRWAMQRPGITSTVIGPRSVQQLEECLTATTFSLSSEQIDRLNVVSKPQSIYPYHLQDPDGRGKKS